MWAERLREGTGHFQSQWFLSSCDGTLLEAIIGIFCSPLKPQESCILNWCTEVRPITNKRDGYEHVMHTRQNSNTRCPFRRRSYLMAEHKTNGFLLGYHSCPRTNMRRLHRQGHTCMLWQFTFPSAMLSVSCPPLEERAKPFRPPHTTTVSTPYIERALKFTSHATPTFQRYDIQQNKRRTPLTTFSIEEQHHPPPPPTRHKRSYKNGNERTIKQTMAQTTRVR